MGKNNTGVEQIWASDIKTQWFLNMGISNFNSFIANSHGTQLFLLKKWHVTFSLFSDQPYVALTFILYYKGITIKIMVKLNPSVGVLLILKKFPDRWWTGHTSDIVCSLDNHFSSVWAGAEFLLVQNGSWLRIIVFGRWRSGLLDQL